MSEALQRGTVVRIHGLHSKPSLNDALALVVGKHSEDRWVVRPTSSPDSVAVRYTNLHRARELSEGLRQSIFTAAALSVLLVALAARAGTRSRLRAFVPLASLLWYLVAVLGCYWVHSPLLGSGVYIPAISEMGVSSPARLLYRVAFGLCGFLLAVTLLQMYDLACSHHPEETTAQDSGLLWGLLASFGIALQGVCTLRLDFAAETALHLGGAMLTMFGTFSHAERSNEWFESLPVGSPLLRRGWRGFGLYLRRDRFQALASGGTPLMVMFAVPLLLEGAKRLGLLSEMNLVENCMGVMLPGGQFQRV
ncbi:unnamed protein product [Symbiodinium pilosum]|uniref:Uncharacterized protein n=1 Tax=Symbiodinium pilosum TaxID=2952 RepID=A0A812LX36_SYMPI|nr:unnamed protein product [Symbiodinium pilosum]